MAANNFTLTSGNTHPYKFAIFEGGVSTIIDDIIKDYRVRRNLDRESSRAETAEKNPVFEKLAQENSENFYAYIEWLGLAKDPSLIVIPTTHHYYYEVEDLKEVKTIVNLKQLNNIKKIKDFLYSIYHNLAQNSYFIGSFIDKESQIELFHNSRNFRNQLKGIGDPVMDGISSGMPFLNVLFNLMNYKSNGSLTRKNVRSLLEDFSLKVVDMTEMDGTTYFCTQKILGG